MNFYTNTIATISRLWHSIVRIYHRIINTIITEQVRAHNRLAEDLTARLVALEMAMKAEIEEKEHQIVALETAMKAEIAELKQSVEEKERQIVALESRLTTDLSKHLEAIKHLAATKREAPNVQGDRPELLR
jgi:predicted  nucleic acid-binding Zn-ribbon protein